MALEEHDICAVGMFRSAKEVIEPDFIECGCGSVCGDVATNPIGFSIGFDHHGHRVPPDEASDSAFNISVSGIRRLPRRLEGVHIRCARGNGEGHPFALSSDLEISEEFGDAFRSAKNVNVIQRVNPVLRFQCMDAGIVCLSIDIGVGDVLGHVIFTVSGSGLLVDS